MSRYPGTETDPGEIKRISGAEARAAFLGKKPGPGMSANRYNLTIGDEPRFIWFRNAKVGTRSTLELLAKSGVKFAVREAFRWHYPTAHYEDVFKFAFVRNPWDRLVSGWRDKIYRSNALGLEEGLHEQLREFDSFVDYIAEQDMRKANVHFRSQVELIDVERLDFVGRFERFEADVRRVMETLGIEIDSMPWKNKSQNRRQYPTYYCKRTRDVVGKVFEADIEAFGYRFEGPDGS